MDKKPKNKLEAYRASAFPELATLMPQEDLSSTEKEAFHSHTVTTSAGPDENKEGKAIYAPSTEPSVESLPAAGGAGDKAITGRYRALATDEEDEGIRAELMRSFSADIPDETTEVTSLFYETMDAFEVADAASSTPTRTSSATEAEISAAATAAWIASMAAVPRPETPTRTRARSTSVCFFVPTLPKVDLSLPPKRTSKSNDEEAKDRRLTKLENQRIKEKAIDEAEKVKGATEAALLCLTKHSEAALLCLIKHSKESDTFSSTVKALDDASRSTLEAAECTSLAINKATMTTNPDGSPILDAETTLNLKWTLGKAYCAAIDLHARAYYLKALSDRKTPDEASAIADGAWIRYRGKEWHDYTLLKKAEIKSLSKVGRVVTVKRKEVAKVSLIKLAVRNNRFQKATAATHSLRPKS